MTCPNCHSDQIISVQNQHFCINCGQMVPEESVTITTTKPATSKSAPTNPTPPSTPMVTTSFPLPPPKPAPAKLPRKRKVGRPKAVRLDVPKDLGPGAEPTPPSLPLAPKLKPTPAVRRVTDLSPTTPAHHATSYSHPRHANNQPIHHAHRPPRPVVHKVGVPPLHFGAVLAASLRARVKPHWLALATIAALAFGIAAGYVAWLIFSHGLPQLATRLTAGGPKLFAEAAVLGLLYYLGRSLGHTAITYGLARETDSRPVSLGQQLGVAINTFGRRLILDLSFGLTELIVFGTIAILAITGGAVWPINLQFQIAALFLAFLALLYLATALGLTHGLAGVAITLTLKTPVTSARLGWQLFSHRVELLGLRLLTLTLEFILALPLAALAVALIITAPASLHLAITIAIGLLATLTGALFGAGTAAWWVALYRRLITITLPADDQTLLTSQPSHAARRGPLTVIVALVTFLITIAIVIPFQL